MKYLQLKQNEQTGGMDAEQVDLWWQAYLDNSRLLLTGAKHQKLNQLTAAFQWKFGKHRFDTIMSHGNLDESTLWVLMQDFEQKKYQKKKHKYEKERYKKDMCYRYLPAEAKKDYDINKPAKSLKSWHKVTVIRNKKTYSIPTTIKQPILLHYDFTTLDEYKTTNKKSLQLPQSLFHFIVSIDDREHKLFRLSYDYLYSVKEEFKKLMRKYPKSDNKPITSVTVPTSTKTTLTNKKKQKVFATVQLVKPFYGNIDTLDIVFINCLFDLEIQRIISIIWEYRKDISIRGEGGRNTNNRVANSDEDATEFNCKLRSNVCSYVHIPDVLREHLLGMDEQQFYCVPYHSTMHQIGICTKNKDTLQLTRPSYKEIKTEMAHKNLKGTNTHVLSASFVSGVVLPCAHALNDKFNLPLSCVSITELMLTDVSTNEARPECHKYFGEPRSDAGSGWYAGKDEVLLRSPEIDKHHLASMFAAYLTSQNKENMIIKGRLIRNIACSAQVFTVLLNNYKKTNDLTTSHPLSIKSDEHMSLKTHIVTKLRELGIMSTLEHNTKIEQDLLEKAKNNELELTTQFYDFLNGLHAQDTLKQNKLLDEMKIATAKKVAAHEAFEEKHDNELSKMKTKKEQREKDQDEAKKKLDEERQDSKILDTWLSFCSEVGLKPDSNHEHMQMQDERHDELNFLEMFTNDKSLEEIIKNIIRRGKKSTGKKLSKSLQNLINCEFDIQNGCTSCSQPFLNETVKTFDELIEQCLIVENGQIKFKCISCNNCTEYSVEKILEPWVDGNTDAQKKAMDNSYDFIQYFINLLVYTFMSYQQ